MGNKSYTPMTSYSVLANTGFNLHRPTMCPSWAAPYSGVTPPVGSALSTSAPQGHTLVYFSAQPEPLLTLKTSPKRLSTPSTPAINTP